MSFSDLGGDTGVNCGLLIATLPVTIPVFAAIGIIHGVKAALNHGIIPGIKRLGRAACKDSLAVANAAGDAIGEAKWGG